MNDFDYNSDVFYLAIVFTAIVLFCAVSGVGR